MPVVRQRPTAPLAKKAGPLVPWPACTTLAGESCSSSGTESYVTPKTVEVHLSNAYRKLNIASRRELPQALTA
jgi:hypothetical protein